MQVQMATQMHRGNAEDGKVGTYCTPYLEKYWCTVSYARLRILDPSSPSTLAARRLARADWRFLK